VISENCYRRSVPKLLSGAQAPRLIKATVGGRLIAHCSLSAAPPPQHTPLLFVVRCSLFVDTLIREKAPVTCHL